MVHKTEKKSFSLRLLFYFPAFVGGNPRSLISAQDSDESSIRRACSLSDLSMGKGKNIINDINYIPSFISIVVSFSKVTFSL